LACTNNNFLSYFVQYELKFFINLVLYNMDSEFATSCAASTTVEDSIDTFESNKSNSHQKISSIHAHCHLSCEDELKISKDDCMLYYYTSYDYLAQVINNIKSHFL